MSEQENPTELDHRLAFGRAEGECEFPTRQNIPRGDDWVACFNEADQLLRSGMDDLDDEAADVGGLYYVGGATSWQSCSPLNTGGS